jgi:ligand-binding SRPBCC domain-containing protein
MDAVRDLVPVSTILLITRHERHAAHLDGNTTRDSSEPERVAMRFMKESVIRASPERVFAFHQLPDALRRLTPSWEGTEVVAQCRSLDVGQQTIVRLRLFGIVPLQCVSEHTRFDPPHMFEDRMLKGPFPKWVHQHVVLAHPSGAILRDDVEYEPPLWMLGRLFAPVLVAPRLKRLFDYRHEVTRAWCENTSATA